MSDWEIVRRQVAIAGRVTDAGTGSGIAGAEVAITQMPSEVKVRLDVKSGIQGPRWDALAERPDRTRTRPDGSFYFLDLPGGSYAVTASVRGVKAKQNPGRAQVKVAVDKKGNVTRARADITLEPPEGGRR